MNFKLLVQHMPTWWIVLVVAEGENGNRLRWMEKFPTIDEVKDYLGLVAEHASTGNWQHMQQLAALAAKSF